jgi:CRP-like cAMP-binding protein
MSKISLLRKAPLFANLPEEQLEALVVDLGRRTFAKGMIIFHKGSLGQNLYLIESGIVRIFILGESGNELTMNVFGPGDSFGELSMLDGFPRSAGAIAMEKTVTYTLHRDGFLRNIDDSPLLARSVLAVLSERLRYTTILAESYAFMDAYARVAAKLIELGERYGVENEGIEIDLRLTQTELASWVAVSRESTNKVLGAFRDQGMIRIDGGKIVIQDFKSLQRLVVY